VASAVDANAQIEVFDVNGRRVRSGSAHLAAGWQDMEFDGRDDHNQPLATGVYFYRLRAAGETRTQKFVVMR